MKVRNLSVVSVRRSGHSLSPNLTVLFHLPSSASLQVWCVQVSDLFLKEHERFADFTTKLYLFPVALFLLC